MKRAIGIAVGGLLAAVGCQGYQFQPVSPNAIEVQDNTQTIVAHQLSPNIMIVVDRSGSMLDGADGQHAGICATSSGSYNGDRTADCKWNNLLDTLVGTGNTTYVAGAGFIGSLDMAFSATQAVDPLPLGLAELPGPSTADPSSIAYSCAASSASVLNSIMPSNESAIATSLLAIQASGGTPTAATMQAVGSAFPAQSSNPAAARSDYVILLTDGAPNCDSNFASPSATNCSGDRCTLGTCLSADFDTTSCACYYSQTGMTLPEGCLDEGATVSEIGTLEQNGIKTFVIGFGAAVVSPSDTETLEEMGQAGATGSSNGYSANSYYAAANTADLQAALAAILGQISQVKCQYTLTGAPPSQQLIEIIVTPSGGTADTLQQSDFMYDTSTQTVTITNMTVCNEILSSTVDMPIQVEIKYLQSENQ